MNALAAPLPFSLGDWLKNHGRERRFSFGETLALPTAGQESICLVREGQAAVVSITAGPAQQTLAELRPNDVFAWSAIEENLRSQVQLRASSPGLCTEIPMERLADLVRHEPEVAAWLQSATGLWATLAWFRLQGRWNHVAPDTLKTLVEDSIAQSVRAGEPVYTQGARASAFYIVRSGVVRLERAAGRAQRAMRPIAYPMAGDLFGLTSLARKSPRLSTARAFTDATLLAVGTSTLEALRGKDPAFRRLVELHVAATERLPMDYEAQPPPIPRAPSQGPVARRSLASSEGLDAVASPSSYAVVPSSSLVPSSFAPSSGSQTSMADAAAAEPLPWSEVAPVEGHPFRTADDRFRTRKNISGAFPFVRQVDEMDCGAACLLMVLRHFGGQSTLQQIRTLCHVSAEGTSLANLCHGAHDLGLAARGLKVSQKNLPLLPTPAILHWKSSHWVVLLQVTDKDARIADPAAGISRIPLDELFQHWSGAAAIFDFAPNFEEKRNGARSKNGQWFLPFVRPYVGTLGLVLGLALLEAALEMLHPVFTQVIVDRVVVEGAKHLLTNMLLAMGACFLVLCFSVLMRSYLLAFMAQQVDGAILDDLTRRLLGLPVNYFSERRTGDIQRRMDGVEAIRRAMVETGVSTVVSTVQLLITLLIMALYSTRLALYFLACIPVYGLVAWASSRTLRSSVLKLEEASGRYRSDQMDAIKGIEAVKVNAAEPWLRASLVTRFAGIYKESIRVDFLDMIFGTGLRSVSFIINLLFLGLGASDALDGSLSLGSFMAFSTLVAHAVQPLDVLMGTWERLQKVRVHLDRIADVVDAEPEQVASVDKLLPVPHLTGAIEFRKMSFRYGGATAPWILKDISLTIPAGSRVAIVGRSGSGKTTLAKVLAGLLPATEGSVLFDGRDATLLHRRDLRRRLGFVLQADHIFSGSVLENIALGEEASWDRAVDAARLAAAHDFIAKLPMGYQTPIGEQGVGLSGGQRQRIAIARALYRNPSVLIFDEATSALDTESERMIQQNLGAMLQGRTSILIAHRLSTVRDADLIVVLDQGEIAEQGTHQELLERRGIYFQLVHRQVEE